MQSYTPVDIVRNTLGVGPCQHLLDVEGQKQEHVGRATCHVRTLLNEVYGSGQQKAKRKEIESYLGDALDFVTHIRKRIVRLRRVRQGAAAVHRCRAAHGTSGTQGAAGCPGGAGARDRRARGADGCRRS